MGHVARSYGPDVEAALPLGRHLIVEFHGAENLVDPEACRLALWKAAESAGATVLGVDLHDFGDRMGFTGVALLAESHISLHTWPEHGYAALDIFMCGDADPEKALPALRSYFKPQGESVQLIRRGGIA